MIARTRSLVSFLSSQDFFSNLVILLLLRLITKHLIGVVDVLELVLMHASCPIWMVLVAKLVVHVLDVFVTGAFRQA